MQSLIADGSLRQRRHRPARPGERRPAGLLRHELDHRLTVHGSERLQTLGVEFEPDTALRYCVDWTEQAHHLSGALGKALTARRPRTRYPVTASARLLLTQRKLMPDRAWDAMTGTSFRRPGA